jgi:aspartyl-tRNA(Asn)/glutamyl-tRNA(Gln) amidotransferase subunit B
MDLIQNSNSDELQAMVSAVIAKFPEKVAEFKGGKVGLLGMFVGEVMKASKGKADPKLLNTLVREALEQ